MRTFIKAEKSLERWCGILPLYVKLQKRLVPHVGHILSLDVLDQRLETLPVQFEELLDQTVWHQSQVVDPAVEFGL